MCDNEYLAHYVVRERIQEAEANSALCTLLREKRALDRGHAPARPTKLERWWQASTAWAAAQLVLPKMSNRL
jgi:hypothetical protein